MKSKIAASIFLFLITYGLVLFVWLQVKSHYGYGIALVGVRLASWSMDTKIISVSRDSNIIHVTLQQTVRTYRVFTKAEVELTIEIGRYTFNVPITFAIMAALFPFFRWHMKMLIEAGVILAGIHLLYVFFYTVRFTQGALLEAGVIATPSIVYRTAVQFTWLFIDNLVLRFEPFLMGVYIYFRNVYRTVPPSAAGKDGHRQIKQTKKRSKTKPGKTKTK